MQYSIVREITGLEVDLLANLDKESKFKMSKHAFHYSN